MKKKRNFKSESDYFRSEEFHKEMRKNIEAETWDKGLPMFYSEGDWLIRHWKDGRKEKIKKINIEKTNI